MKLISTYFSDDQMRTSWVFLNEHDHEYVVDTLDNRSNKESRSYFSNIVAAEDYAEDWVL